MNSVVYVAKRRGTSMDIPSALPKLAARDSSMLHSLRQPLNSARFDLYPASPALSCLSHPRRLGGDQEPTAHGNRSASKNLGARIATAAINYCAGDRWSGENGKADNGEHHAHADPKLSQVSGQKREGGGEKALDACSNQPVDDCPCIQSCWRLDGDEAVDQQRSDNRGRYKDIHRTYAVGNVVRDHTANCTNTVEDQ